MGIARVVTSRKGFNRAGFSRWGHELVVDSFSRTSHPLSLETLAVRDNTVQDETESWVENEKKKG